MASYISSLTAGQASADEQQPTPPEISSPKDLNAKPRPCSAKVSLSSLSCVIPRPVAKAMNTPSVLQAVYRATDPYPQRLHRAVGRSDPQVDDNLRPRRSHTRPGELRFNLCVRRIKELGYRHTAQTRQACKILMSHQVGHAQLFNPFLTKIESLASRPVGMDGELAGNPAEPV